VVEENHAMQTVTLNNGVEIPVLGFGVFQIPEGRTSKIGDLDTGGSQFFYHHDRQFVQQG
jgi:diketogulonate reductase-like aldo/keto reductase